MSLLNAAGYSNLYAFNNTSFHVIDTLDFAISGSLSLPTPVNLFKGAYNPNTNKVYITSNNDVYILYAKTNDLTTVVSIGFAVNYVDINYETNSLYIASLNGSKIAILNCNSLSVETITLAANVVTYGIAVNPRLNVIYIVDNANNAVLVYDGATNTQVGLPVGVQSGPTEVVVNINNANIYVANTKAGSVTVINSQYQVISTITSFTSPAGLACNAITNTVFVVDVGTNTLSSIDSVSNVVIARSASPENSFQGAIYADDRNNCVYASATFSVYKVDAQTLTFPVRIICDFTPTTLLYYKLANILGSLYNPTLNLSVVPLGTGTISGTVSGTQIILQRSPQLCVAYNANAAPNYLFNVIFPTIQLALGTNITCNTTTGVFTLSGGGSPDASTARRAPSSGNVYRCMASTLNYSGLSPTSGNNYTWSAGSGNGMSAQTMSTYNSGSTAISYVQVPANTTKTIALVYTAKFQQTGNPSLNGISASIEQLN